MFDTPEGAKKHGEKPNQDDDKARAARPQGSKKAPGKALAPPGVSLAEGTEHRQDDGGAMRATDVEGCEKVGDAMGMFDHLAR